MRSNRGLLGVIAALTLALIGVTVFAIRGGGATKDGNPVGYDVTGSPSGQKPTATTKSGCLESGTCKTIEIHYLRTPPEACPTILVGTKLCNVGQSPTRALPPCPKGAQCIQFSGAQGKGELDVTIQDLDGVRSYTGTDADGIIILQ